MASWHSLSVEEVLERLNSSMDGLTDEEAAERLRKYGPNELERVERPSPLRIFARQFTNILIIILLAATLFSILVGEALDAIAIIAIVVAATILGFSQEYRAEKAIEALKRMLSPTASVLRGSKEREILVREIVPGDIIILEAGDKVPADARIIEEYRLQVDEAPLTGESTPVQKEASTLEGDLQIPDMRNMVFAGTTVTDGKGRAVVVATGMNTEFGKIAREVAAVKKEKTPLERRMEDVGRLLSKIMLAACFTVILAGIVEEYLRHGVVRSDFAVEMILFGVALAVAAVPEALPAIVTGTLAIGMREMAKANAIVRKMAAVETLGSTSVICTDKTGTLTKGEMTVRKIYVNDKMVEVTGVGYEPKGEFLINGEKIDPLGDEVLTLLLEGAVLCNEARLVKGDAGWRIQRDPTEGALIVAAAKAGIDHEELKRRYPRIAEIPFSSERKRMTTIHKLGEEGGIVFMKGAPETVLERCSRIREGEGGEKPLTRDKVEEILKVNLEMAEQALRVLGVAYKKTRDAGVVVDEEAEENLTFLGLVGMMDPPREEAVEAIKICREVEMKPIMITGDQKLTAIAVAREMGIYREGDIALTGAELEALSEEELAGIVDRVTVYARVSPLHKVKIVKAWKKWGEVVAMTGDGVNDAPALRHADIGVAMGITGTEVTKEAADMVITDDNFATIVKAVERGRWIYDNIKKYLLFLLQCNLVELIVLAVGVLVGFPLPLLPAQILYVNLATDGLPAIALGVTPPEPDIMKRPPRSPKEGIFTRDGKRFLAIFPAVLSAILLGLFATSIAHGEALARTRMFLALISFELAIALSMRSLRHSVLKVKPDRFLSMAVAITAVQTATLMAFPTVRQAFRINMPTREDVILIAGISLIAVVIVEALKKTLKKL
ncbi:MAG: cation-translocating P-type ATPase [Candidatus Bathyarchaeia archaeon]